MATATIIFLTSLFLISFAFAVAITPAIRSAAIRKNLLDQALNTRKLHHRPVPRLGGIAIVVSFYLTVVGALLWPVVQSSLSGNSFENPTKAVAVLLGGLVICGLGLYDDLIGAGARQKFIVQFGVAAMLYLAGLRIEVFDNPFGHAIPLGSLAWPVTVLWITGVMNAMNLIDGLDGLAGGVAVAAAAMICAASAHAGQWFAMVTGAALAGSVCGFLVYNFNPASIFLGDTGSLFLGYVIATASIRPHERGTREVALISWVVALGIPVADTCTAIVRRAVRGAPIFAADREHIHHRLLELGLTERQVTLILWSVAALLSGAGMTLAGCSRWTLLVALAISSVLALNQLGCLRIQNVALLIERRKNNLARRRAIAAVGEQFRNATRLVDLGELLQDAAPALGAQAIWLRMAARGDEHDAAGPRPEHLLTRHSVFGDRKGLGVLEVEWGEGKISLDRDTEIAIELLCEHVANAVRRMAPPTNPMWRLLRLPFVQGSSHVDLD
ncbi:MAG TPA: MraY family glycosyltransferase [Anaeromyxobacteraceae bacterium]|nr:MraY family glycosyltransferase [Anaeromyxobacteraceae bacterium]